MRSGGFHQNSFHRRHPWEHHRRNIRERFVKDVLSSGVKVSAPNPKNLRTTVQKIKSDYGSTLFVVDTSALEPNISIDNSSFDLFLQEYAPQISHIRNEEGKKLFEKPNPLEIIGLSIYIPESTQREQVNQSAKALGKDLSELTSTQTQTKGQFFSPPQTQEEIEQKIDFTTHYKSQVISEYRRYLIDILEHIRKRKLPFEFGNVSTKLMEKLLDLPTKIQIHGCWRARELSQEDWSLMFYAALNLHITEQDTTVLTRDGSIIDVIKYIRRHKLWEEGELLEGFTNLQKLHAATIDKTGNLKYIVGPNASFPNITEQSKQKPYDQFPTWRLPDYIKRQQQQTLEQIVD